MPSILRLCATWDFIALAGVEWDDLGRTETQSTTIMSKEILFPALECPLLHPYALRCTLLDYKRPLSLVWHCHGTLAPADFASQMYRRGAI